MELSLLLFLVGFIILVTSARILVKGAISVARALRISTWFIGIAVVGIGTSIPELAISLSSTFAGNNIGLGAIIGGNTFNLLMILGLIAFFSPIYIREAWYKDIFINITAVSVSVLIILFPFFEGGNGDSFVGITQIEGGVLLALFFAWFLFMLKRDVGEEGEVDYQVFTTFISSVMILVGVIGVFIGGRWVVAGAETLALLFSVPPAIIGLTIVGIGTSLPELVVSLVALSKGQQGIAVGNIIGSNVFGFLGILGITGLVKPLPVLESMQSDAFIAVLAALLVAALIFFVGKRGILSRGEGMFLILSYIAYLFFILS